MMRAEPGLRTVLAVAACRESYLLDYTNARSRFAFTFGDGAAGALLTQGGTGAEVLETEMITDGSLAHHVKVPAGGSVEPASAGTVRAGRLRPGDIALLLATGAGYTWAAAVVRWG